jgi:hypothetical protein
MSLDRRADWYEGLWPKAVILKKNKERLHEIIVYQTGLCSL